MSAVRSAGRRPPGAAVGRGSRASAPYRFASTSRGAGESAGARPVMRIRGSYAARPPAVKRPGRMRRGSGPGSASYFPAKRSGTSSSGAAPRSPLSYSPGEPAREAGSQRSHSVAWKATSSLTVERWSGLDELAHALEGPVWDRYGGFAGQPWVRGTVTWTVADRCVLIGGQRGGEAFEEVVL